MGKRQGGWAEEKPKETWHDKFFKSMMEASQIEWGQDHELRMKFMMLFETVACTLAVNPKLCGKLAARLFESVEILFRQLGGYGGSEFATITEALDEWGVPKNAVDMTEKHANKVELTVSERVVHMIKVLQHPKNRDDAENRIKRENYENILSRLKLLTDGGESVDAETVRSMLSEVMFM